MDSATPVDVDSFEDYEVPGWMEFVKGDDVFSFKYLSTCILHNT